jgi:hypothetical protein
MKSMVKPGYRNICLVFNVENGLTQGDAVLPLLYRCYLTWLYNM